MKRSLLTAAALLATCALAACMPPPGDMGGPGGEEAGIIRVVRVAASVTAAGATGTAPATCRAVDPGWVVRPCRMAAWAAVVVTKHATLRKAEPCGPTGTGSALVLESRLMPQAKPGIA
ncbi:hypothetical protein [Acetobacter persici]|uniref:hypothetical protein n=1 Tax=Acetobacter persici TaxID=1076596 RepID=UPI0012FDD359|nr:hypothetical protein [Acetobacter persici]